MPIPAMTRLPRFFERFSLRQRFMVEPLLGLLLLIALAAAFTYQLRHENVLLKRVADSDIAAYDRYSELFVNLSQQHMALLDVLHGAGENNEDQIYDEGKRRLNSIHETVRGLERALPVDSMA